MVRMIQRSMLVLAVVVLTSWASKPTDAQDAGKSTQSLSEADIVGLIAQQADDRPILKRLARVGIAFKMDESTLTRIKQANPSPEVLAALAKFLPAQTEGKPKIVEQAKIVEEPKIAAAGKAGWEIQNSGVKDDLLAIASLSKDVAVAVGRNRTILKTADGGKSWKRVIESNERLSLDEVVFSSPKDGWAIESSSGWIFSTTDGGDTWKEMPNPDLDIGANIRTHAAVGATYFYMTWGLAGPHLFQSANAGKDWTNLTSKLPVGGYGRSARLAFADLKHGYFVTSVDKGKVGRTEDGGKTWMIQKTEDEAGMDGPRICFVNKDCGWYSLPNRAVYATTDAGKTWIKQNPGHASGFLLDLHFTDAQLGHVLVSDTVRRTTDGGKTWEPLGELKGAKHHGLSFPSASHGWVVGDKGYIACYGAKAVAPVIARIGEWQVQNSGVQEDLHSVAFVNDQVGVAVGDNYTILRTTDAGKNWKQVMGPKKQGSAYFASVLFANDKVGYVRNQFTGDLYHTADAGATWQPIKTYNEGDIFAPNGFSHHAAAGDLYFWQNSFSQVGGNRLYVTKAGGAWTKLWESDGTLGGAGASLVFTSATEGWMASINAGTPHRFFVGRSSDGGKTWKKQELKDKVSGNWMLVHAVDKDHGWCASDDCKHVFASTDGGQTWTPHELGNGSDSAIRGLQFRDARSGYVLCGNDWHVRQTTDGCKSWKSLGRVGKSGPGGVNAMFFTPSGVGYVVGARGFIARYQDK